MRSTIKTKTFQFILITGLIVFFLSFVVIPVSAELRTINPGATIFIGESNLDITNAVGSSNAIGFWRSAATITTSAPTKTINLAGRQTAFSVAPSDFVGYTGYWFPLTIKPDGTTELTGTPGKPVPVFNVQDPELDIKIWDFKQATDMSGKSVPGGEKLGFRIETNLFAAVDPQQRPNVNAATDGYININVEDMNVQGASTSSPGPVFTSLYNAGGTTLPLTNQFVNIQPWTWGDSGNPWYTDAQDQNGQFRYPAGTYRIWAVSTLNNMKDNYKDAATDYQGKTVSHDQTVTIVSAPVVIQTSKETVVRSDGEGGGFYIMINSVPSSTYDVYINDGDVSGLTPPTLVADQYNTLISPGHIRTQTSISGTGTPKFVTSQQTTPRVYTFKVVSLTPTRDDGSKSQTHVEVLAVAPTPTSTPTQSIGNIVIQSNPTGATIFLDNAIKGITPLTINSVSNGAHTVLLRLQGYQDSSNSITILGNTQTINPTLTPINAPTTGVTTVATTGFVTSTPTTGIITTQMTTTVTTATPRPTAKVNHSATIAAMQSQIAEQNAKIEEQGSWIDQILRFLGLK